MEIAAHWGRQNFELIRSLEQIYFVPILDEILLQIIVMLKPASIVTRSDVASLWCKLMLLTDGRTDGPHIIPGDVIV